MARPKTRIAYTPHDGVTPQAELNVLCAVYGYLLSKKTVEPAPEPDGRDGTTVKENTADAPIIRQ